LFEYQPDGISSEEKIKTYLNTALNKGSCTFDWTYRMLDGTEMPSEIILVRLEYKGDYVVAGYTRDLREHNKMINEIHDTSTQLRSALELAEEQRRIISKDHKNLQTILDMLPVGVRIMRINDGALVYANKASLKVFNCDSFEDQVSGRDGFDFMPEIQPDGKKTIDIVADFFEKDNVSIEMQCLKLGGEPFIARITSSKINYQGAPSSLAVVEDVTAEKEYQETLKNIAIKEREANKAKSNFLSTMSHEMRTPMNAIIGMTAIGKKAEGAEKKNHALNRIGEASSHLLGVINDVLDMAKIEADKLELTPVVFNFERMLKKVITVINFRVEEKKQKLSVKIDNNIPEFIFGDDQRLAQVITNLLSNAVKFTPEDGNVRFEIFLTGITGGVCELRIEVTDSGIGIDKEQQERLFIPFEQGTGGISRQYGGTGLGLVISKRIIELMDGRIWVESGTGKGAKFIFTIKAQLAEKLPAHQSENALDENFEYPDGEFTGKRMLLAEDIEINREILITLLENTGLEIECAENGKEALEMVEAAPDKYDIIFMDVQMPHMDGLEATRCIRALPALKNSRLPIIAMTANVFMDDIENCLAAGMDDHLGKPLDIDKIFEKLHKYINN
jgi:signal transduction histidine kinase/ActR/RegA family two-component response regulator